MIQGRSGGIKPATRHLGVSGDGNQASEGA